MRIGLSNKITQSLRPLSSSSSSEPVDSRPQIALDLTDTYGVSSGANYLNVQFPYSFVELNSTNGAVINDNDPFANYRDSGAAIQINNTGPWYLPPIIEPLKITLTLNSGSGVVGSSADIFLVYPAALTIYLSHHPGARELAFSEASLSGAGTPFGTTLDIINHTAIVGRGGAGGRGGLPGVDKNGNNGPGGGGGGGQGFLGSPGGTATSAASAGTGGHIFSTVAPAGGAGGIASGHGSSHLPGVGRLGGSAIALYQTEYPHLNPLPKVSITNQPGGTIFGAGGGGGGGGGSSSGSAGGDGGDGGLYADSGTAGDNGPGTSLGRQTGALGGAAGKAIDESEFGSSNFVDVTPINNAALGDFKGSEANYS